MALVCLGMAACAYAQVDFVDPTIGNVSILLVPTRPAVYLPNSMVRMYPMREDALHLRIRFFPLTISSHRDKELFSIMSGDGSPADYDDEVTTPYFYATRFNELHAAVEFTATERCGYFRFGYPNGKAALVLANRLPGDLSLHDGNIVEGEEQFNGMKAYVYGVFSVPVTSTANLKDGRQQLAISANADTLEFRYGISFISTEQA